MTPADAAGVLAIFAEGIATGNATFETRVPPWEVWDASHVPHSRWVAGDPLGIAGWAALMAASDRSVYAGVAEVSVYVAARARGAGHGRRLLQALAESSEAAGLWTLQAQVLEGNTASVGLHEASGFRVVGTRERLGQLHGVWRNVLLLERRSRTVGR